MANEINNSSVNSKGKIVIKVVAIAAIAAVLFFLGGPIFRFISTTSASAATFMGELGAKAAETFPIFAAWILVILVLAALSTVIYMLCAKLFGKIKKPSVKKPTSRI